MLRQVVKTNINFLYLFSLLRFLSLFGVCAESSPPPSPYLYSDVYKACMDEEKIERTGLGPLLEMLKTLGGWPVLSSPDNPWDETTFDWMETVYTFRRHGYSTDYLVDFSIVTDSKNSSWRVIDIDQVGPRPRDFELTLSQFIYRQLEFRVCQKYYSNDRFQAFFSGVFGCVPRVS